VALWHALKVAGESQSYGKVFLGKFEMMGRSDFRGHCMSMSRRWA
jgi:hypothetical protein